MRNEFNATRRGNDVALSTRITNTTASSVPVTSISAEVDANGIIVNIVHVNPPVAIDANGYAIMSTPYYTLTDLSHKIKFFVWDSLSGMHPMTYSVTYGTNGVE